MTHFFYPGNPHKNVIGTPLVCCRIAVSKNPSPLTDDGFQKVVPFDPPLEEKIAIALGRLIRNAEIIEECDDPLKFPLRTPLDRQMAVAQYDRWNETLDGYLDEWCAEGGVMPEVAA